MTAYNVINPGSLVAGQPEDVSQILANLNAIAAVLNGNIDNANVSAAAALAISKLAGYPTDATKVLKGDGTWAAITQALMAAGNKVTQSTLAGGPPGAPTDGDIWIASGVSNPALGNTSWMFRYNSANATYKWEFIGGPPTMNTVGTDESTVSGAAVNLATVGPSITLARAGQYIASFGGRQYNTSASITQFQELQQNGAAVIDVAALSGPVASQEGSPHDFSYPVTAVAGAVMSVKYFVGGGTGHFFQRWLSIIPVAVI